MTLLQEIQRDAVDSKSDLPTLLRKCRILAAKLKNEEFKTWVQNELDGYRAGTTLPGYRRARAQSLGDFAGAFSSGLRNAPIPLMSLPNEYREFASTAVFAHGVSELQNMIANNRGNALREYWPADLVALVAGNIMQDMNLMQACKIISPSTVVGILDTIRTRILNFVLEIESAAPDAGEGTLTPELTPEKVTYEFHTTIMGNVGNVATGSSNVSQHAIQTISHGDWNSLARYLKSQGVQENDLNELKVAVHDEPKASANGFGKRVTSWIGMMLMKSAEGTWNVATTAASVILAKALAQYYGLPDQ